MHAAYETRISNEIYLNTYKFRLLFDMEQYEVHEKLK